MTLEDLVAHLDELESEAGHTLEWTVRLRHGRGLMVFHPDGQQVAEGIVPVRGPVQDTHD